MALPSSRVTSDEINVMCAELDDVHLLELTDDDDYVATYFA